MKWYFYNEKNAIENLVTPYLITDIQPTNEELLKTHIISDIEIVNKDKHKTILKVNILTKELVVIYEKISPTIKEELDLEKKRNTLQEEQINTSLMANVELFEMILAMQNQRINRNINLFNIQGGSSSYNGIYDSYATLINKGIKDISEVPNVILEEVKARLVVK